MAHTVSSVRIAGFPALQVKGDGARPPLLFLHGSFAGHEPFRRWIEFFANDGWGSIAPSRRGRAGIGPDRAAGLSIADYVEDTLAVVEAMGEAPVIVGHSLGGLIAQKLAELGKARALVLLAPAPAAMLTAQAVALPTYLTMMPRILAGRPILPTVRGCATIALNRMPADECPIIHGHLVHESGSVYREMIFGTYKVDFSRIKCPAMVLGGAEDRIISTRLLHWTARKLGVTPRIYDAHAHWLLEEAGWERVAGDVAAWLEREVEAKAPPVLRRIA